MQSLESRAFVQTAKRGSPYSPNSQANRLSEKAMRSRVNHRALRDHVTTIVPVIYVCILQWYEKEPVLLN